MKKTETYKEGLRRRYLAVFDEVRDKQGVDDKTLCQALKVPASVISGMRSGRRGPTIEQIVKICDKYDYDLAYVIRGDDKLSVKRPATGVTLEQLYKELQDLRETQDNQFRTMLEALIILKNKSNPIDPKEWIKKVGKS